MSHLNLKNILNQNIPSLNLDQVFEAKASILLISKQSIDEALKPKIQTLIYSLIAEEKPIKYLSREAKELTSTLILQKIKIQQPISLEVLTLDLKKKHYIFNSRRLNSLLDLLRKRGLIFRNNKSMYILTEEGLKKAPTGKYKNSSDILRALELGKRKW